MKKPIIGLTPSHNLENGRIFITPAYVKALADAGALCIVLPPSASKEDLEHLVSICDGILFTGGPDVHPFLFGEDTLLHCGESSPERDQLELNLLPLAMAARKPILGICRGAQLINIALGGDIYQDLESQFSAAISPISHKQPFAPELPCHYVSVSENSLLARITGANDSSICFKLEVNSLHHQAIRRLASGLTACAHSADGLVEAIEMPEYPFLVAVQWHPEYLFQKQAAARGIFKGFVQACKQ